ncbi:MAG: hypothetical protein ACOYL4_01740 [Miltoncostaeaceae bacterium]
MDNAWGRWNQRGQATVEHVGITLVVALLMAAMALWASGVVRVPDHPPAIIARVTAPLGAVVAQGYPVADGLSRQFATDMEARPGQPGLLHRVWDGFLSWGALNVDGELEALGGFTDEVRSQAEGFIRHPLETAAGIFGQGRMTPARQVVSSGGDIARDALGIGDRPLRESFLRISRAAGAMAADWLIVRGARFLRVRAIEAVRRR